MKAYFLFLVFAYAILSQCFGQGATGYVITTQGEHLTGTIDVTYEKNQMHSLKYSNNGISKTYSFDDVKEYKYNKVRYIKYIVEVSDRDKDTTKIYSDSYLQLRKDTVFIKELYKAENSLYSYIDQYNKSHFFIEVNGELMYLLYDTYKKEKEDGYEWVENKKYISILTTYFDEFDDLMFAISKTRYDESSLKDIFREYYNCKKNKVVQTKVRKSTYLLIGAQGQGFRLVDNVSNTYYDTNLFYSGTGAPSIGVINFANKQNKEFFRLEASYAYINTGYEGKFGSKGYYTKYKYKMDLHLAQLQGTAGYCFGNGEVRFVIAGGVGYYYAFSQKLTTDSQTYSNYSLYSKKYVESKFTTEKGKIGIPLSIGFRGGPVMFEVRHDAFNIYPARNQQYKLRRISAVLNILI